MTKLIWCGGLIVELGAVAASWPTWTDTFCWATAGLLGAMPIGYGIAASMLSTLVQDT